MLLALDQKGLGLDLVHRLGLVHQGKLLKQLGHWLALAIDLELEMLLVPLQRLLLQRLLKLLNQLHNQQQDQLKLLMLHSWLALWLLWLCLPGGWLLARWGSNWLAWLALYGFVRLAD